MHREAVFGNAGLGHFPIEEALWWGGVRGGAWGSDRWASVRGGPEDDREAPRCSLGALSGVQDNHELGPGVKSMRTICFS